MTEDDPQMSEATKQKEEGNALFKAGQYDAALACYTKALELNPGGGPETGVYHKNRAAVYLKQKRYEEAVADTTKALEFAPNDPKALFRRCQAYDGLEKYEEAYKDAVTLIRVDPKNTAIQPILQKLNPIVQERLKKQRSTDSKVSQMFELAFDESDKADAEKMKQAANNLIVLAREEAGANRIVASEGIPKLITLLDKTKDKDLQLTALRVLACLANNSRARSEAVLDQMTLKKILVYMALDHEDVSTAAAHLLQNVITWISDVENIRKAKEKFEERRKADVGCKERPWVWVADKIDPEVVPTIDLIFKGIIAALGSGRVSGYGRDNAMELIIKLVTRRDGVGWQTKFVENGGLQNLLEVAGTVAEHGTLKTTTNSRMHASLALSKLYEDLVGDKERQMFVETVNNYFVDMLGDNMMESKLEAVMALAALLQGPFEVGNAILGRPGMLEMIIAMVDSGNVIHVKYAVEALVHSVSKKDRCSGVIKQATPILKQLYQSQNDQIRVRALVGLCKLGSFGGTDASMKSFADGSTLTLAKACRKFLSNQAKDVDLRKWAAEGLAYLSLDADVKEDLCEDMQALKALMELAQVTDKGVLYPCAQIMVNVTNSYTKPKIEPELIELAKFAKQHVPEEHDKDKEDFVAARIERVVQAGVVNALVALSKAESENSRELLARVFLAVCREPKYRGLVVQQGGAKVLIPLAREGTKEGKMLASQALAKIAITNDPAIAFPGQRVCETVKPISGLLDIEAGALQTYEGLLAMTNLASMNDTVRKRIVKEKVFPLIENYMYDTHEELRTAAAECLCNLVMCEEVIEMFKEENDRVKLFVLLCHEEEDERVVRAAAGGLAMMSYEKVICGKIISGTKQWFEILSKLAVHQLPDIQHRGVHILMNMMAADKEIASNIVESTMMEILMALSMLEDAERQGARQCALKALESAVEWGLIKPNKERTPQMAAQQMQQLQALQQLLQRKKEEEEKEQEQREEAEKEEGEGNEAGEEKGEQEEKKGEGETQEGEEVKQEEKEEVTEQSQEATEEGEKEGADQKEGDKAEEGSK